MLCAKQMLTCTPVRLGALQSTRPLFIWPILARIAAGVAVVAMQSFFDAHREEVSKMGQKPGDLDTTEAYCAPMHISDALSILNVPVTSTPSSLDMVTREQMNEARVNFTRYFESAAQLENVFLQAKFSCAYRTLVDPAWDAEQVKAAEAAEQSTTSPAAQ